MSAAVVRGGADDGGGPQGAISAGAATAAGAMRPSSAAAIRSAGTAAPQASGAGHAAASADGAHGGASAPTLAGEPTVPPLGLSHCRTLAPSASTPAIAGSGRAAASAIHAPIPTVYTPDGSAYAGNMSPTRRAAMAGDPIPASPAPSITSSRSGAAAASNGARSNGARPGSAAKTAKTAAAAREEEPQYNNHGYLLVRGPPGWPPRPKGKGYKGDPWGHDPTGAKMARVARNLERERALGLKALAELEKSMGKDERTGKGGKDFFYTEHGDPVVLTRPTAEQLQKEANIFPEVRAKAEPGKGRPARLEASQSEPQLAPEARQPSRPKTAAAAGGGVAPTAPAGKGAGKGAPGGKGAAKEGQVSSSGIADRPASAAAQRPGSAAPGRGSAAGGRGGGGRGGGRGGGAGTKRRGGAAEVAATTALTPPWMAEVEAVRTSRKATYTPKDGYQPSLEESGIVLSEGVRMLSPLDALGTTKVLGTESEEAAGADALSDTATATVQFAVES